MTKEQKFYTALRDLFVGAKVEGDSGYINLMRIKSRYFEKGVFPKLQEDVEKATSPFTPHFREELFDKLYSFFSRYFSESGSIYFRYTPLHQNVYEKVYTDDKDVMLFWKTHMLYYVKTDRLFKNMDVEVDAQKFFFDVSSLEHKKANEKRELIYTFKERRKDGALVFTVGYSEKGKKTKLDEIQKTLKKDGHKVGEEILERAFRVFGKQSEVDYFINKNAKAFLEEQFNLWLYQYVFAGESEWTETRIKQLQALKDISFKIIAFISQFEDELVKIWNKPKFVLNSNYVITLDRIAEKDIKMVERLIKHQNFKAQVGEWKELGIVQDSMGGQIVEKTKEGGRLVKEWRHLPLDTRHFKDIEGELLALFDNIDKEIDGWLINSENYQALKTLLPKFKGRVSCVYIDPPYNSPATEIMYENKYKSSSWLSLLNDRLSLGQQLLEKEGVFCIAIDDNEYSHLAKLVEDHFPEILGVAVVRSNPAGRSTPKGFSLKHEYAIFLGTTENAFVGRLKRTQKQEERYSEQDTDGKFEWVNFRKHGGLKTEAPKMFYPIYIRASGLRVPKLIWMENIKEWKMQDKPRKGEHILWPIDENGQERRWKWGYETLLKDRSEARVDRDRMGQLAVYIKSRLGEGGILPSTWWEKKEYSATDHGARILKQLFGEHGVFSYPKSPYLVEDCLKVADLKDSGIAFDFFAGSGTTAEAIINMNREDGGRRRYVLIEMGEYFESVLLPRVKKLMFSNLWKEGKAEAGEGVSHFVKYFRIEQYEDSLRQSKQVSYGDSDLFNDPNQDPYNHYVFLRDLKMLTALEVDLKQNKVKVDLTKLYKNIDIPETLSNLTGKWIKRITADTVEFEDGEKIDLKNIDYRLIKPLIWW